MGHRKKHAPKHGSLAYSPRKRAKSLLGRVRRWPDVSADAPKLLGFVGYKAGMTHLFVVEDRKRSPNYGKEVIRPATILETPPMHVCAIRAYSRSSSGLHSLTEAWMENPPQELERILTSPSTFNTEANLKRIEESLDQVVKLRVVAITHPKQASVSKKKPEILEIEIGGGEIQQKFEYAKTLLGKPIPLSEVFREGQYVDAVAVTTGKGFQGPVKRWGVRILQRKARKTKRGVATLGPWKPPRVRRSVPRAGQMGYHQRTECNKRIMKIGTNGEEVTPEGGFVRYGVVQGSYVVVDGSIPGPEKRPITLRYPTRLAKRETSVSSEPSKPTYLSLKSPQGK